MHDVCVGFFWEGRGCFLWHVAKQAVCQEMGKSRAPAGVFVNRHGAKGGVCICERLCIWLHLCHLCLTPRSYLYYFLIFISSPLHSNQTSRAAEALLWSRWADLLCNISPHCVSILDKSFLILAVSPSVCLRLSGLFIATTLYQQSKMEVLVPLG